MDDVEKLREVSRICRSLGKRKDWVGPRNVFNKSDYRDVLNINRQTGIIIEGKLSSNKTSCYINLIFSNERYKKVENIQHLISGLESALPNVKVYLLSVHIADDILQHMMPQLGFVKITRRDILLKYRLSTNGTHISFMKG